MNISTSLRVVGSNLDVDMWYFILKMFFFSEIVLRLRTKKYLNQECVAYILCISLVIVLNQVLIQVIAT